MRTFSAFFTCTVLSCAGCQPNVVNPSIEEQCLVARESAAEAIHNINKSTCNTDCSKRQYDVVEAADNWAKKVCK
jgi:hypothetical protein